MKYLLLLAFITVQLLAQDTKIMYNGVKLGPPEGSPDKNNGRILGVTDVIFHPELKPFYHGVASGDPLNDAVIIWTRVTPESDAEVTVTWKMSTDIDLKNVVKSGEVKTNLDADYTVKIDVIGLNPATTYYYQFEALGSKSIIGRTRTAPATGSKDRLRLAVVSCSNYQWGFFNAYENIAQRADLDAVVHMGDYIYEYGPQYYAHPDYVKYFPHEPQKEIISKADYRTRFSQYRLDIQSILMHQQHPMIAVWDDHESTNDSYRDGADNHNDGEGTWADRVNTSTSVYAEWMPIRIPTEDKKRIYRKFSYGDNLDLIMMELRLSGKDQPMGSKASGGPISDLPAEDLANVFNPDRKMIDDEQFNWVVSNMASSTAKWKILGSSVMMVPFPAFFNPDAWDGYFVQRETLFGALAQFQVKNWGAISGDFHMAFGTNLVANSLPDPTKATTVGFEFTTPSISSANLNEQEALPIPDGQGGTIVINPLEMKLPERSPIAIGLEQQVLGGLPWFKYANTDQHGYMVLDVTEQKIQCDWFHVASILEKTKVETNSASAVVLENNPTMNLVQGEAGNEANAPALAPKPSIASVENSAILPVGIYPNPAANTIMISFAINQTSKIKITISDLNGNEIAKVEERTFAKGVQGVPYNVESLLNGTYFVRIESENNSVVSQLNVVR